MSLTLIELWASFDQLSIYWSFVILLNFEKILITIIRILFEKLQIGKRIHPWPIYTACNYKNSFTSYNADRPMTSVQTVILLVKSF